MHFSRYSKNLICSSKSFSCQGDNFNCFILFFFICFPSLKIQKTLLNTLFLPHWSNVSLFVLFCYCSWWQKSRTKCSLCGSHFWIQHSSVLSQLFQGTAGRALDTVHYLSMQAIWIHHMKSMPAGVMSHKLKRCNIQNKNLGGSGGIFSKVSETSV